MAHLKKLFISFVSIITWTSGSAAALAQVQPKGGFDVASIRLTAGSQSGPSIQPSPNGLTMRSVTLGYCIRWAYGMRPYNAYQTIGPDWIDPPHAEFYEITAKTGEPVTEDRLKLALQALRAERFKLSLHLDNRSVPAYVLTAASDNQKLAKSSASEGEGQVRPVSVNVWRLEGVSMGRLTEFLGSIMYVPSDARPIIDETGPSGKFDFTLDIQRNYYPALDEKGHVDMAGNVIRALPQLGLKLVPRRAPVQFLVIDHVEKIPSGN